MVGWNESAEHSEILHVPDLFEVDFEEVKDRIRENLQN